MEIVGVFDRTHTDVLYTEIEQYGIRHATTTAMPPTGTSSTIANISKSLEPHFSFKDYSNEIILIITDLLEKHFAPEQRTEVLEQLNKDGIFSDEICLEKPFLKTACQIDSKAHIQIQAGFQCFLDDAISKTVNLDQKTTVNDVLNIIYQSYEMGLKGLAVFRNNCLSERSALVNSALVNNRETFFSSRKREGTDSKVRVSQVVTASCC